MADIPDQAIVGRIEHVMDRHRQFDHTQAGAQMPAGDRNSPDRIVT